MQFASCPGSAVQFDARCPVWGEMRQLLTLASHHLPDIRTKISGRAEPTHSGYSVRLLPEFDWALGRRLRRPLFNDSLGGFDGLLELCPTDLQRVLG